ncbi:pyridoxal phosphate-dependent aminotransferase [Chitinilyticum piscinae]|uniref:Putative 8-amino-7-oxononanoate synthase n=1 Tax=Chitinilyticum piscinae TaxID=2866724 RepID=A0A8J7K0X2_9NEIS|nr:pyridoxal phosphate-dependent aminotransferase [Chitinilyticum piscinae]MBE9607732.1 pyridoxal phosphate-dependent aminotransferase [Chitinilyticum piscinae]
MPHTAPRLARIEPFHVMRILGEAQALAASGRDVIHLEVGEPDFPTPQPVIDAGIAALQTGKTFYTGACGLPELREAIAGFYRERLGAAVTADRVIVTPGASGALQLILALLVGRDDEVLLTDPGYPCNRHLVSLLEGRPVNIPVDARSNFQLTPELIRSHSSARTVATLLASPANPTGTVLDVDEIKILQDVCNQNQQQLIVDEIYQGLVYDSPHTTALTASDQLFVVNSFSKFFQMTGWRLGWLVAPEWAVADLEKLAQNLFLAPPTTAQHAALAAFRPDTLAILEQRRQELQARRNYLQHALGQLGLIVQARPEGAFYLWLDCRRFTNDAEQFARELLHAEAVAVTPGRDFGDQGSAYSIRIAYSQPINRLEEAITRIGRHLRNYCAAA